jgi:voltage-gated potassium channel
MIVHFANPAMILQLLLAMAMASLTVVVHAIGTTRVVMPLAGNWTRWKIDLASTGTVLMLTRVVGGLLVLHLLEMAIWAVTFRAVGVLPDFESSLYYSLESYTTVGFGDLVVEASWRLVGPIEAAVGILMFGWSTGFIVAALQRIYSSRPEA